MLNPSKQTNIALLHLFSRNYKGIDNLLVLVNFYT